MERELHLLQGPTPFSQSLIWELQRKYYDEMGAEAWRQGEVPHYVTSNLRQANAYAEVIIALYKDARKLFPETDAPIHIVELGAGSGRMAYYMLRRLQVLCEYEGIPFSGFRYILTDFTQSNLDYWHIHPRFTPFIASGQLDIALFDATQPAPLQLQISGETIGPGYCKSPAVVIANYVWDSIPQELLVVSEGQINAVDISLATPEHPSGLSTVQVLETVMVEHQLAAQPPTWMQQPVMQPILQEYVAQLQDSWILFPAQAITCLEYLRTLSSKGLLLLTADKGGHQLTSVASTTPPTWAAHGSISMNVNYHALQQYCIHTGGQAFFPDHTYHSINTGFLLLMDAAEDYGWTLRGSRRHLADTGPDTYFTIYKCIRTHLQTVQLRDILAALRLSLYDSHQLAIYVPRIATLVPEYSSADVHDLMHVLQACWENYFPLVEQMDLATTLGSICYALDAYAWAIFYFSQSTDIYGSYTGTFYNMAVCHYMLGNKDEATALLEQVVMHDPGNAEAQVLLDEYQLQAAI